MVQSQGTISSNGRKHTIRVSNYSVTPAQFFTWIQYSSQGYKLLLWYRGRIQASDTQVTARQRRPYIYLSRDPIRSGHRPEYVRVRAKVC